MWGKHEEEIEEGTDGVREEIGYRDATFQFSQQHCKISAGLKFVEEGAILSK